MCVLPQFWIKLEIPLWRVFSSNPRQTLLIKFFSISVHDAFVNVVAAINEIFPEFGKIGMIVVPCDFVVVVAFICDVLIDVELRLPQAQIVLHHRHARLDLPALFGFSSEWPPDVHFLLGPSLIIGICLFLIKERLECFVRHHRSTDFC
jgi:hypothetical protein